MASPNLPNRAIVKSSTPPVAARWLLANVALPNWEAIGIHPWLKIAESKLF